MIKIQKNLDTVGRLKELLDNLRYLNNLKNGSEIEVEEIGFVTPLSITPLATIINKKELKNSYKGENSHYLDTIFFPGGADVFENCPSGKTFFPIIHLKLVNLSKQEITRGLSALHTKYLELLKTKIIADPRFIELITNNTFGFVVGEAFDNIEEHSIAENAYIFAQYWPKINACEICIIDDGQGLFGSLKNAGRDVANDFDALKKILETGLSAKDEFGDIKRGTGIKHTRAAITNREINGEYIILTGNAGFLHSASIGEKLFKLTDYKWQGTIIVMRLNRPFTSFNLYDYVKF